MDFEIFVTPGLGDNSYLVRSDKQALFVDPQRDIWRFLPAVEREGLSVQYVLETHVHNDYLSGARAIQATTGAEIAAPAGGNYEFPIRGLRERDEIRIGNLGVVALETPGHTPEHLSYLVFEGDARTPVALFTGGSLIVGGAGRTDLLGPERTEELARAQFRSLRRLATYADDLNLLPTHGAGSFCVTSVQGMRRTSTLGAERTSNPALLAPDEESFLRQQLSGLPAFPTYYRYMASINRKGPVVLQSLPTVQPVSPAELDRLMLGGAWLVDARDRNEFAHEHVPGALNVEMNITFASYVGWIIPFGSTVALIVPDEAMINEAMTQLLRIGYDRVGGYLAEGVKAWKSEGRPVKSYSVADIDDLCRACLSGQPLEVLDVRQKREWDQGHIPEKSRHIFIGPTAPR